MDRHLGLLKGWTDLTVGSRRKKKRDQISVTAVRNKKWL